MTRQETIDFCTTESLRMESLASQYRQMGFRGLAKWLKCQARAAMKFAAATCCFAATLTAAPYHSDTTDTCAPAPCAVQSITPHPSWIGGPWISHTDSGANASMLVVPNGTVISFYEHVIIGHAFTHAPLRFAADDTAALWVNGSLVQPAAPAAGNAYITCSDFGVTCSSYTEIDIARWLIIGANELRFDVEQRGRWGYGVAWAGEVALTDIGDPPVETPEPDTGTAVLLMSSLFFFFLYLRAERDCQRAEIAMRDLRQERDTSQCALWDIVTTITDVEGLKRMAREALEDK